MFVAETQIFTNFGWKQIQDISGNDKVLVKNFLGDAEFIQPFALKKRQYDGKIITIGAKDWSISTTPEHRIVYGTRNTISETIHKVSVSEMKARRHFLLDRKFKYMFFDTQKKECINIYDDFGKRTVTISDRDWYKLIGFVLTRGFIYTGGKKPMLWFFLDPDDVDEERSILSDILDRIGVYYHVQYSEKTRPKLVVSSKNTLATRVINRLGSKKRKTMRLPDKIVYSSSKELTDVLMNTIIDTSRKKTTEVKNKYQLKTTNIGLINDLEIFGTLGGYSMRHVLQTKAGTEFIHGIAKKDSYILHISPPIEKYSVSYVKKTNYSGYIYGIDLFEGQVYVKQKLSPIWVNPK